MTDASHNLSTEEIYTYDLQQFFKWPKIIDINLPCPSHAFAYFAFLLYFHCYYHGFSHIEPLLQTGSSGVWPCAVSNKWSGCKELQ